MLSCIDLALENLFSTRKRNRRNLSTQLFARAVGLLLDLGFRRCKLTLALFRTIGLAVSNNLVRPCVSLIENAGRLLACFGDNAPGFSGRFLK